MRATTMLEVGRESPWLIRKDVIPSPVHLGNLEPMSPSFGLAVEIFEPILFTKA